MDEAEAAAVRYWCHMCSQTVDPIMEVEMIKCPLCQSGFVEEINSTMTSTTAEEHHHPFPGHFFFGDGGGAIAVGGGGGTESESDRALSLWAPILLGMMSNPRRRRRLRRRMELEDEDEDDNEDENDHHHHNSDSSRSSQREGEETELDRELESIIRRRRRSSATILQLLRGIRAGMLSSDESDNPGRENGEGERDRGDIQGEIRDSSRERVILINPFNQTIIVQGGPYDPNNPQNQNYNPIGSLGDYFIGPGLDLLLQHLAENDPNRYGSPPAQKEAVEAMPTVKIEENLQCSVCLEDFEVGTEAKEMPCKHKFHSGCILPWLELHSSCPVCRYQLPSSSADDSKEVVVHSDGLTRNTNDTTGENNNSGNNSIIVSEQRDDDENGNEDVRNGNGRRFSMPFSWPPSSWFSSSSGNGSSTSTTPSASSSPTTDVPPQHASHNTDEN